MKTFSADPLVDRIEDVGGRMNSCFTLGTGRSEGMHAWAIMVCMALWLRQKDTDVPRRERAEIAMTFS